MSNFKGIKCKGMHSPWFLMLLFSENGFGYKACLSEPQREAPRRRMVGSISLILICLNIVSWMPEVWDQHCLEHSFLSFGPVWAYEALLQHIEQDLGLTPVLCSVARSRARKCWLAGRLLDTCWVGWPGVCPFLVQLSIWCRLMVLSVEILQAQGGREWGARWTLTTPRENGDPFLQWPLPFSWGQTSAEHCVFVWTQGLWCRSLGRGRLRVCTLGCALTWHRPRLTTQMPYDLRAPPGCRVSHQACSLCSSFSPVTWSPLYIVSIHLSLQFPWC